jgi:hypothetical protein
MHSYSNVEIAEAYIAENFSKPQTALRLGIKPAALYEAIKRNNKLRSLLESVKERSEEYLLDLAESQLVAKIREGDFKAIKFFLETKGRKRGYGRADEVVNNDAPEILTRVTNLLEP